MKGFLLDENLPRQITFSPSAPVIAADSFGSSPSDSFLWNYAKQHELAIVSKDADFSERIILSTPPPWVVHLRFGNLRRNAFHAQLERLWPQIEATLRKHKLVNVYEDRVEGIG